MTRPVIVITVARKPLGESSVARNALKHGTGGLNIEACRLPTGDRLAGGAYYEDREPRAMVPGGLGQRQVRDCGEYEHPGGRWPANVVLQHKAGCQHLGTKRVKSTSIHGNDVAVRRTGVHSPAGGHQTIGREQPVHGYADADGMEMVEAWECAPGCPVTELDEQSGITSAYGGPIRQNGGSWKCSYQHGTYDRINDTGGTSRYFKQVQED